MHHAYLLIEGSKQGLFKGSSTVPEHKEEIEVLEWSQEFSYNKETITEAKSFREEVFEEIAELKETSQKDVGKIEQLLNTFPPLEDGLDKRVWLRQVDKWRTTIETSLSKTLKRHEKNDKQIQQVLEEDRQMVSTFTEAIEQAKAADNNASTQHILTEIDEHLSSLDDEARKENPFYEAADYMLDAIKDFRSDLDDDEIKEFSGHEPIEITKLTDNASGQIMQACWTGEPLKRCEMNFYRPIGGTVAGPVKLSAPERVYMQILLTNAYIDSYTINHDSDDELPTETVHINYDKAEFRFIEADPKTGQYNTKRSISYDWQEGKLEQTSGTAGGGGGGGAGAADSSSDESSTPAAPSLSLSLPGFAFGGGGGGGAGGKAMSAIKKKKKKKKDDEKKPAETTDQSSGNGDDSSLATEVKDAAEEEAEKTSTDQATSTTDPDDNDNTDDSLLDTASDKLDDDSNDSDKTD